MTVFRLLQAFLACFIISEVVGQQPIVSVDEIEDGGTFSVTCDASRMSNIAYNIGNIFTLTIRRQTSQDISNVLLAQYRTYGSVQQNTKVPFGRQWTVRFTGVNGGTNNRHTMKIVVQVSDAVCQDAGMYTCEVQYEDSNHKNAAVSVSGTENVTAKSAVRDIFLDANKYNAVPGRLGYSLYEKGDNITLTCRVDGPQDLQIYWKQGSHVDFINSIQIQNYPYTNHITTSDPSLITSGPCSQYKHRSVLNLRSLSQDNDGIMYLCVVKGKDNFGAPEVARANITIGVTSGITTPNPGPAITSDEGTGGFSITITVDAGSVTIPEDGVTDIVALTLNRRTTQDQDFQLVAQYKAYGSRPEVKNIPPGRDWTVTFSGANGGTNNRNTMKMEVVIQDAQSSDAGLYQIIVRYTRPQDGAAVDVSVMRSWKFIGKPHQEDEDSEGDKDDDNNIGAIIGGTIAGCIVSITGVVVIIYFARRKAADDGYITPTDVTYSINTSNSNTNNNASSQHNFPPPIYDYIMDDNLTLEPETTFNNPAATSPNTRGSTEHFYDRRVI